MKFDPIKMSSAPEVLVDQIIKQIKSGELEPGACLPSQRELSKMFGVALGSVREAVKILNVMGYLDVIRGKGTYVSESALNAEKKDSMLDEALEAVTLSDLMVAREVVESGAARLAATEGDEESIAHLKKISKDMEVSFHDKQAFYKIDFSFGAC